MPRCECKFFKEPNAPRSEKTVAMIHRMNFAFQKCLSAYSASDSAVAREPLNRAARGLTESWQPIRINDTATIKTLSRWIEEERTRREIVHGATSKKNEGGEKERRAKKENEFTMKRGVFSNGRNEFSAVSRSLLAAVHPCSILTFSLVPRLPAPVSRKAAIFPIPLR